MGDDNCSPGDPSARFPAILLSRHLWLSGKSRKKITAAASCYSPRCPFPAACSPFPAACCSIPVARCLLHAARCQCCGRVGQLSCRSLLRFHRPLSATPAGAGYGTGAVQSAGYTYPAESSTASAAAAARRRPTLPPGARGARSGSNGRSHRDTGALAAHIVSDMQGRASRYARSRYARWWSVLMRISPARGRAGAGVQMVCDIRSDIGRQEWRGSGFW